MKKLMVDCVIEREKREGEREKRPLSSSSEERKIGPSFLSLPPCLFVVESNRHLFFVFSPLSSSIFLVFFPPFHPSHLIPSLSPQCYHAQNPSSELSLPVHFPPKEDHGNCEGLDQGIPLMA